MYFAVQLFISLIFYIYAELMRAKLIVVDEIDYESVNKFSLGI